MGQREVDAANERILLSIRARLLRDLIKKEPAIDRAYKRKVEALKKALKRPGPIRATTRRAMRELSTELEPILTKMIRDGALKGDLAAQKQFSALFSERIAKRAKKDVFAVAQARIRGTATVDKVRLSARLWKFHSKTGTQMAEQIQASIRAGRSLSATADRLIGLVEDGSAATGPPRQALSRHVTELRDAARRAAETGQPNLYQDAVRKYEKQIDKLGQAGKGHAFTLRPATKQLVKDLERAGPAQIDAHVDRFMLDKARTHARMIARSETIEAYQQSYIRSTESQPFTKGYRRMLAGSHPEFDECDPLAGQDLHGLGPGGYPADALPETPHPNDLCAIISIIDENHFKREKAKRNGDKEPPEPWLSGKKETSADWYRRQPKAHREKILGPTRARIFQRNPEAVLGRNGVPRPVKDVLKRNAP